MDFRDFDRTRRRVLLALLGCCLVLAVSGLLAGGSPPREALVAGIGLGVLAFVVVGIFVLAYWGVTEVLTRSARE